MAPFLFLVQLLFVGALIIPANAEGEKCISFVNTTESNFTVSVTPDVYWANTTYLVTIRDKRNLTDSKDHSNNVTAYLLQALSPQNISLGKWHVAENEICSSIDTAVLPGNQTEANWTSPESNITFAEIRAYIRLRDNSTQLTTVTLNKEAETTTATPVTTPNSVSVVQSSSFFVAIVQLPLLLITSKLLS